MQLLIVLLVGSFGMFVCTLSLRKQYSMSVLQSVFFTLFLTVTGVSGAKLMFFLESGSQNWSGISFFGSVFLIPLLMPLIGYLFHLKAGQSLDLCAPCVAVMIAILRVNCFLSGCCGGWQMCVGAFCFYWPTQIIESFGDIVILYYLLNQGKKSAFSGLLYPYFMLLYGAMRFLIEFFRDTSKDWLMLSHGQWFSIAAILFGVLVLLISKRKASHNGTDF